MIKNLFEAGEDVDVEALMSRIRESTKQSGSASAGALAPQELKSAELKALQPQNLSQEIQAGSVYTDTVNRIPLKTSGSTLRIERPIKKFLKWLAHWNTRGQVEFSHSAVLLHQPFVLSLD